ncbi:Protein BONZAI 1 [Vitis vinifera]|uniref:Protein BONZAI 1 n=1 Tax=Vitis vinifera TaxID=29760 RepID=A0A438K9C9_VITVI|nr:Protein BONZAI 1 [Vitis vinifera]
MVGNGQRVSFWKDKWCEAAPLCYSFPALFAIATSKEALVEDVWTALESERKKGRGEGNDWEMNEVENLLLCLSGKNVIVDVEDRGPDEGGVVFCTSCLDIFDMDLYYCWQYILCFHCQSCLSASNGNPRLPDSLHYIDPSGRPNAYQRAILEVGEVLQFYDSDKRFPAWGFGARPIDGPVSHCFNLNGSSNYCEVDGIQGIMMAYTSALFNVSLAGPTLFGPVISSAAQIASQSLINGRQKYYVLLIITDGVITDLQETKDALVKASDLPLSIFILGVGGADFKEMEVLDADKGERLESSNGRVASRDIVQFVPFRDVHSKYHSSTLSVCMKTKVSIEYTFCGEISVVQALLAELPTHFLTYMRTRNILPNS